MLKTDINWAFFFFNAFQLKVSMFSSLTAWRVLYLTSDNIFERLLKQTKKKTKLAERAESLAFHWLHVRGLLLHHGWHDARTKTCCESLFSTQTVRQPRRNIP